MSLRKGSGRGYFGVVVYAPKTGINIGTLFRSAFVFGAAFVATVERRYQREASDVVKSWRHMPLWHFLTVDDLWEHLPYDCRLVVAEIHRRSKPLQRFTHPVRAVYLLGPEDGSVPEHIVEKAYAVVQIPGDYCLNLASAGTVVMYDRLAKT